VRLETLGNVVVLAAALIAVGTVSDSRGAQGSAAGLAGFSLSFAMALTGFANFLVRSFSEMEQAMNCVERVLYYSDTVEQEPFEPPAEGAVKPPPSWPARGAVEFKDYEMRYRPATPLVLKGVSFRVRGGEKVRLTVVSSRASVD
jgi:ABC-type multidrug transport system fused ATPase/permease subunit